MNPRSIELNSERSRVCHRRNFPFPSETTRTRPSAENRMPTATSPTFVSKVRLATRLESAELQTSMTSVQVRLPSDISHFRTTAETYSPPGEISASSMAPPRSIEWSRVLACSSGDLANSGATQYKRQATEHRTSLEVGTTLILVQLARRLMPSADSSTVSLRSTAASTKQGIQKKRSNYGC